MLGSSSEMSDLFIELSKSASRAWSYSVRALPTTMRRVVLLAVLLIPSLPSIAQGGYERLLAAGSIQTIEPQPTTSRGYRDIITAMHGSAWDSDLRLYKFDGREYRRSGCFFRTYDYLDIHGRMRELKRPRITPAACRPDDQHGS